MSDVTVESTSDNGFTTRSVVGDWELTVDATNQNGPDPIQVLVANYVSCFVPALRVGARREGIDELGVVSVTATATLDDDDALERVAFDITVESTLADVRDDVVARAEDLCHVHDALRDDLHAEITLSPGADL
jgi:OsmC-like protein.